MKTILLFIRIFFYFITLLMLYAYEQLFLYVIMLIIFTTIETILHINVKKTLPIVLNDLKSLIKSFL